MTGPAIRPGPFAFLAGAGEALGAYARAQEEERQQKLSEARQAVTVIEAARDRGILTPDYFTHPDVVRTYQAAGLPVPTAEPTVQEKKNEISKSYLSGQGDKLTDEQLAASDLPSRSSVVGEKFAQTKGKRQLDAATSGTPAQQEAVTGVPNADTAEIARVAQLDPAFMGLATRYVAGAVVRAGGRIPESGQDRKNLLQEAYNAYYAETKAQGKPPQPPEVFQSYFDAALQPMLMKQRELDVAAIRAQNTGQGTDNTPNYLNAFTNMSNNIRQQTAQLRAVMENPVQLYNYQKANGFKTRDEALAAIQSEIRSKEQIADGLLQSFGGVAGASRVGGAAGSSRIATDEQAAYIAAQIQSGKLKPSVLDEWVAKGEITEGDRQAIQRAMKVPFSGNR